MKDHLKVKHRSDNDKKISDWRDERSQEPEARCVLQQCSASKLQVFMTRHLIASYRTLNAVTGCIIANNAASDLYSGIHLLDQMMELVNHKLQDALATRTFLNAAFSFSLKGLCMTFKRVLNPVLRVPVIESDQGKFYRSRNRKHRQSYLNDQHHHFSSLQYSFFDASKKQLSKSIIKLT